MINNKPMTYKEIEERLKKERFKYGFKVFKISEKGILIADAPDTVDMFDTLMDRYIPTYYERDKSFGDMDFQFYVRTYRRNA